MNVGKFYKVVRTMTTVAEAQVWCLCGDDGFPYHLQIYKGKEDRNIHQPLGTRVILDMCDIVQQHSVPSRHFLFFDNFFTSYSLMNHLTVRRMKSVGTVRENRCEGAGELLLS